MEIGDEVQYIPSRAHARQCNAKSEFPWVLGWLHQRMERGEVREDVEVLTGKRLAEQLEYLSRHNDKATEAKKLVAVAPAHAWPAKVTAVNDDGTVDLDVQAHWCEAYKCGNGVTLHYRNIKVVDAGKVAEARSRTAGHVAAANLAHTCHAKAKPAGPAYTTGGKR